MKTSKIVSLGGILALCGFFVWFWRGRDRDHAFPRARQTLATNWLSVGSSNMADNVIPSQGTSTNGTHNTNGGAIIQTRGNAAPPADRHSSAILDDLLSGTNYYVRVADVPSLDSQSEARLIAELEGDAGVIEKYRVIRMLAFRGGPDSFSAITNALIRGFTGQRVGVRECAALSFAPALLGIMAVREDLAQDFLLTGAKPKFWEGKGGWQDSTGNPVRSERLAGSCVKGLGLSGLPEARDFLDRCRAHPEEVAAARLGGAVNEAAFLFLLVEQLGPQRTMDEICLDPRGFHLRWDRWSKEDPEGQEWWEWAMGVLRATPSSAED